jgi:hypothetical protein
MNPYKPFDTKLLNVYGERDWSGKRARPVRQPPHTLFFFFVFELLKVLCQFASLNLQHRI